MARIGWPLLVLLGLVCQAAPGRCQELSPPILAEAPSVQPRPPAYVLPPHDQLPAIEPIVDPILDDSPVGPPGFFTNVELFVLRPHLNAKLIGSPNQVDTVTLPIGGALGNVLSPRFEFGYRLPKQQGEFLVGYQFETGERTFVPTDRLGAVSQKDRLNVNILDVDWGNRNPFALGDGWDLRFNVGVRLATIYFDTRRNFGPLGNADGLLDERATSDFVGIGPEAGMELSREVLLPGLALVGRISGAGLFGNIRQSFAETTVGAGGPVFASDRFKNQVEVPMLTLQGGLSYAPPGCHHSRFLAGYLWEEFWQAGRLNSATGDLVNRGWYVRVEWNF